MPTRLLLLIALALPQTRPTGGAIAKFVPPVPTPASFISDLRTALKPAERATLDARIRSIQSAGLGDIAVAILPSIGGYEPQQVAVEIYRTWKVGSVAAIGSAHRNVGLLILIVPKEMAPDNRGHCFIITGTGSEGIITDATAGTICRDAIIPHLRARDYGGAIGAGITALETKLRGDSALATTPAPAQVARLRSSESTSSDQESSKWPFGVAAIAGLLFLGLGARKWARYRRRDCPRCGNRMQRLYDDAEDAKLKREELLEEGLGSIDYDVWACGCGEATVLPYRSWFSKYSDCRVCHRRTASSTRHVIHAATRMSSGRAQDQFRCKSCGATWTVDIILPQLPTPSSSSSSGGGGGGGSSFGGSGSTSGGGGGGSY